MKKVAHLRPPLRAYRSGGQAHLLSSRIASRSGGQAPCSSVRPFSRFGARGLFAVFALVFIVGVLSPWAATPAHALGVQPEEKVYYYLTDHLGGVDAVLDDQGNVVERREYLPFGSELPSSPSEPSPDPSENYGFTGKELDDETGLYYYGARYYDPVIGRFTSQDPMVLGEAGKPVSSLFGDPQSLNGYSYVLNNPLKYIDPWGLAAALIFGGESYTNQDNPDEFYEKAQSRADQLTERGGYDEVHAIKSYTTQAFQDALGAYKDIELIEYYGHGDSGYLFLGTVPDEELTEGNRKDMEARGWKNMRYSITNETKDRYKTTSDLSVNELNKENISSKARVHLYSCDATFGGYGENASIGGAIGVHFDFAPVYGSNGGVSYNGIRPRKSFGPLGLNYLYSSFGWIYDDLMDNPTLVDPTF